MEAKSTNLINYKAKLTEQTQKMQVKTFVKLNDLIQDDKTPLYSGNADSLTFKKLLEKVLQKKNEQNSQKYMDEFAK